MAFIYRQVKAVRRSKGRVIQWNELATSIATKKLHKNISQLQNPHLSYSAGAGGSDQPMKKAKRIGQRAKGKKLERI